MFLFGGSLNLIMGKIKIIISFLVLLTVFTSFASCKDEEKKSASVTTTSPLPDNARLVSTSTDGAFIYNVYADYAEITSYTGGGAVVSVPEKYEGVPVISIGKNAFYGNTTITSVTLPMTVLNIDNKAFAKCENLTVLNMPGVKAFGLEALRGSGLKEVVLPAVLENFGKYSLADTQIETIVIPENIIRAGDYIFSGCTNLKSVVFASSTTEITARMFYGCTALTEVKIPPQIKKISEYAYSACSSLTALYIPSTVTEIGEGLFYNSPNAKIYTTKGSTAQKYAEKNKVPYEIISEIVY